MKLCDAAGARDVRESPQQKGAHTAALPVVGDHDGDVMCRTHGAIARDAHDATLIERDQRFAIAMVDVDEPCDERIRAGFDRSHETAIDGLTRQPPEESA